VYAIFSVFFTDPNTGYIAGDGDMCRKTTDGGLTWNYMQMPVFMNKALRSVCFPTRNTGYVTGDIGYVFKTIDGGNTWTTDSSGTSNYLTSVFFTDSITGYVVGSGGTILKKGHGGEPYLSVLPSAQVTGANAGSASFLVTSNTNWNVFSDSSWCTVTPSGSGNDTIFASYTANTSVNPRVDTIRVYTLLKPFIINKIVLSQEGISGIESINRYAFRIYPNPAMDKIILRDVCSLSRDKTVTIFTITGKIVSSYQFRDQHPVEIDIANLVRGMYLVKVQTDSGIEVQKLVIK
jgi:hypothetical protein